MQRSLNSTIHKTQKHTTHAHNLHNSHCWTYGWWTKEHTHISGHFPVVFCQSTSSAIERTDTAYLDRAESTVDVELSVTDGLEGQHCQSDVLQVLDGSSHLCNHAVHERIDLRQDGLIANVHVTTYQVTPCLHLHAQTLLQLSWVPQITKR